MNAERNRAQVWSGNIVVMALRGVSVLNRMYPRGAKIMQPMLPTVSQR